MNIRLSQFMMAEKINSAKLAEMLDIQPSSISHLLSGRNKPSFDFISKLMLMFPELNPDWLINGNGSMYRGDNASEKQNVTILTHDVDNDDNYMKNRVDTEVSDVNPTFVDKPILEPIAHSMPVEVENNAQIEKIILFYNDNTFEISHRRK